MAKKLTNQDLADLADQDGDGHLLTQIRHDDVQDYVTSQTLSMAQYWYKKLKERLPEPAGEEDGE